MQVPHKLLRQDIASMCETEHVLHLVMGDLQPENYAGR